MDLIVAVILIIAALLLGAVAGFFVPNIINGKKITSAQSEANKILEKAIDEAQSRRKDALLEAKEEIVKQRTAFEQEIVKQRTEFEREVKERRAEMQRGEQRITQREEALEKKEDTLEKKEQSLDRKLENLEEAKKALAARDEEHKKAMADKISEIERKEAEVAVAHDRMLSEIEKVAHLSREDAKKILFDNIIDEARHDAAKSVRDIENEAKDQADKKSRNIIALAVQKCAVDHSAEMVVSVVPLPGDDMKGRIIGREGRNIRALENATGVDFIIDDTPEAVVLSGFDPVRREIAKIALEKLIGDGRIHPARIEETVEKVRKDVEGKIKEAGDNAMFEAGVYGLHPDLVKLLGRLKYRTSYGQNVLKHSLEVAHLAGLMAAEIGADINIAKRGGLLHDIGKAVDHEVEGTHISIGVDLARKYKESNAVIHCIAAHHNDIEPTTLEAILVQTADAISGSRPGARRESMENYVKRLQKLESIANAFKGVEKSFAIQAGREVRVMVKPEDIDDAQTMFMAKEIAKEIEKEMEYPGQIKVNVIRELRSVEFAK